jgi:hypothetical protein
MSVVWTSRASSRQQVRKIRWTLRRVWWRGLLIGYCAVWLFQAFAFMVSPYPSAGVFHLVVLAVFLAYCGRLIWAGGERTPSVRPSQLPASVPPDAAVERISQEALQRMLCAPTVH